MDCTVSHANCPKWKIVIMMFFVITFLICIPLRVFADIEYYDFDDLGGSVLGSLALATGAQYSYGQNGVYNTQITPINTPLANGYNQATGRMFATYWEQQGSQTFPSYGSYYDFMSYQTGQVSASMGGRYTAYDSDTDTATIYVSPQITNLMIDFMKWQTSILGSSSEGAIDWSTSMGNIASDSISGLSEYGFELIDGKTITFNANSSDKVRFRLYESSNVFATVCYHYPNNTNYYAVVFYADHPFSTARYDSRGYYSTNSTKLSNDIYIIAYESLSISWYSYSGELSPYAYTEIYSHITSLEAFPPNINPEITLAPLADTNELDFGKIESWIEQVQTAPDSDGVLEINIPNASEVLGENVSSMSDQQIVNRVQYENYVNNTQPLENPLAEPDTPPDDPDGGDPESNVPQQVDPIPHMFGLPPIVFPNITGIWHYVVQWVASLRAWLATMFNIWNILPDAMVYPVWASAVVVIVLGIYKRFFM